MEVAWLSDDVQRMGVYQRALLSGRDAEALEVLRECGLSDEQAARFFADDVAKRHIRKRRAINRRRGVGLYGPRA